jgi:hypothetical protein
MEVGAATKLPAAREWIREMEDTMAFLGGIMSIINPSQYEAGIKCIEAIITCREYINKAEHLAELLDVWGAPFNVISIMNNRDSPLHRDTGGGYSTMDIMFSVGPYTDCRLSVPGVGTDFWYRSGTVIALAGRVVRHGARANGERLCVALYSRETVFQAFEIPEPNWTSITNLRTCTFV